MPFCIVLICGLPGSGKTTLIKFLTQQTRICKETAESELSDDFLSISKYEFCVISYDELVPLPMQKKLACQTNTWRVWREIRKQILKASEVYLGVVTKINIACEIPDLQPTEEQFLRILKERNVSSNNPTQNICFLVEDNFYYSSMRHEWFQLAQKYGLGFGQIYVDCTIEEAVDRNCSRQDKVERIVIDKMAERAEKPDHKKNNWEKNSLIYKSTNLEKLNNHDQDEIEKIISIINEALKNPVEPFKENKFEKEQSRLVCSQNRIHQIDVIIRRCVLKKMKCIMGETNLEERKAAVKKIMDVKDFMIMKVKSKEMFLPAELLTELQTFETPYHLNQNLVSFVEREFAQRLHEACSTDHIEQIQG